MTRTLGLTDRRLLALLCVLVGAALGIVAAAIVHVNLLATAIAGALCGLAAAVVLAQWRPPVSTFQSREQIEQELGLPVLAFCPDRGER